ncbi:hypothetical protein GPECTOR_1g335 [Gonium pectorale]|uniref:Uncharacterized protein n=1 Tax=Gonium pectorale TaxID=33097 RepID=A0A150H3F7_GONPE|nr:hypothetical protein GPECTOR_1g335 [Gonium pectorale]|eukprot:KXZ56378.1 hypothetical protein GPECTOR_1g335 [Gonium pectorale]
MESALMKRATSGVRCNFAGARGRRMSLAAVQQSVKEASTSTSAGPQEEIYIGFVKEEGFGSREGRQGRIIKDDPRKYPSRDAWGTGGWAGGEAGLWKLREEVISEKNKAKSKPASKPSSSAVPTSVPPGKEAIYVGFNKDELELRKSGAKGRVVVDDPRKYPGKEDIGPLAGVAGGFAGGEAGIKQFVATGDVKLRQPGEPGLKQFSPLTLAFFVALAGALGGLALDLLTDAGENAENVLLKAPIDEHTKLLLLSSIGLTGVSGFIVAAVAAIRSMQEKIQDIAKDATVSAAFILVVFLVAKGILDDL